MGWTDPTTRATGELITAVEWNTDLVENLKTLRASYVASITHSANQTVATGSDVVLSMDTVNFDSDSMTTTANRITFTHAGVYSIVGSVSIASTATSYRAEIGLRGNGSSNFFGYETWITTSGQSNFRQVMAIARVNAADYVNLVVHHNNASSVTASASTAYATPTLAVVRVGT